MQAVILVGGQGTRLRPITYDVPKALVPLRNRPFMGYMLDFLRSGGLDGAVLSMGYLPDPIQEYLAGCDLDGFSVDYAVEDRTLGPLAASRTRSSTSMATPSSWSTATSSRGWTSARL